jgi:hypothetical protein
MPAGRTSPSVALGRWTVTNPYATAPRTVAILTRTVHTGAMAVFIGGSITHAPSASLRPWRWLTTLTGLALLASEASHSPNWIHQGRGLMTAAHVGVLVAAHASSRSGTAAPVAALLIGAVASHLPRSVRTWSVLHRRAMPEAADPARGQGRAHELTSRAGQRFAQ